MSSPNKTKLGILSAQIEENNSKIVQMSKEITDLKNIIALLPGNIFWKSKDGRFLGCNNNVANILSLNSPAEIVNKQNKDLFDAKLAEAADIVDNQVYTFEKEISCEETGLDIDGNFAIYLSTKTPTFDAQGQITGLIGISQDITKRKKMEEELKLAKEAAELSQRSKSEFFANMSHDFKTPLAGIIGISELLAYRLTGENLEFAESLLESGRQLLAFLENCLEVAKSGDSHAVLIPEHFQLMSVLNEINELFQPAIVAKGLKFKIYYGKNIPEHLIGSRAGIYRILLNLLGNALKFTPQGEVTITVTLSANSTTEEAIIILTVADTGIGIPKNKQTAIFERFVRLDGSKDGAIAGNGMGLYIVQSYVKGMKGEIIVTSEEHKGSQFKVVIPFKIPLLGKEYYREKNIEGG